MMLFLCWFERNAFAAICRCKKPNGHHYGNISPVRSFFSCSGLYSPQNYGGQTTELLDPEVQRVLRASVKFDYLNLQV